jgi:two-component system LytT family sensor kinase
MKPPADRRLDVSGAGTDVPVIAPSRSVLRWHFVLGVATLLGLISSALAVQFTHAVGKSPARWPSLLVLNCTYWYVWALFTPSIVWLSQRFRLERQGLGRAILVHVPAVALYSLAHIAAMGAVQWWMVTLDGRPFSWWYEVKRSALQNFDWEMMTYWAIAGLSHALLYYGESRRRALRASQLETRLVEAQMAALRQQLQPHFLFNTLHAISALMHSNVEAADRTLTLLSDLLRMTLENMGQQEIPLQEELDFLGKYLEIEQTRFADRLVVTFEIQPETLDVLVPTLLLQPLVENAIKHGISRKSGPGRIQITARRDDTKLWIEIRDNGRGLSETALIALQKGIGVSTTRARLQHQFGADFRFEFHRLDEGVAVVVALPWRTDQRSTDDGAASVHLHATRDTDALLTIREQTP